MFTRQTLELDSTATVGAITETIRAQVLGALGRRGVVVGISGGIDSSVVAALAAKALGPGRVFGLLMPEKHSSDDSARWAGCSRTRSASRH